mmetsp:Transcript_755/g.956  ORF Transcript_755/g.956 Transcript_755/m.956 type:complete len:85 (-) Transcript_755:15-269(-)
MGATIDVPRRSLLRPGEYILEKYPFQDDFFHDFFSALRPGAFLNVAKVLRANLLKDPNMGDPQLPRWSGAQEGGGRKKAALRKA